MTNEFDDVQVYDVNNPPQSNTLDGMVSDGAIVQRQQTQYMTAVKVLNPRELKQVERRVRAEVELDPESTYYEWEVWDKRKKEMVPITGITIGTAMSIARNYGNCAVDVKVDETPTHYIFYPVFLDLESGFTFSRAFRQRKNQNISSKMDRDRADDITFQIGQSKAIRNVVRGATPSALSVKSIEYAKSIIAKDINSEGIEKSREGAVENFKKIGITLRQLAEYTGIPDPSSWDIETVTKLRVAYRAIINGDVDKDELFPTAEKDGIKLKGSAEATKVSPKESSAENSAGLPTQNAKNREPEVEKEPENETGGDGEEETDDLFGKKGEEKEAAPKRRGRPSKENIPFI